LGLYLPVMDGPALIKRIYKIKSFKDIPIVIFSAFLGFKETGKLLEMGVKGFMEKPIHHREISNFLARVYKIP